MPVAMATAESDSRLIERVGHGDRDAFDQLYRRFARPVLAMAVRQLGDNGRAEDAAQETFAAVWRSARSYRAERGSGSA
jgi:RNA polymerase sigma-70 factor (ECF subfamily)